MEQENYGTLPGVCYKNIKSNCTACEFYKYCLWIATPKEHRLKIKDSTHYFKCKYSQPFYICTLFKGFQINRAKCFFCDSYLESTIEEQLEKIVILRKLKLATQERKQKYRSEMAEEKRLEHT